MILLIIGFLACIVNIVLFLLPSHCEPLHEIQYDVKWIIRSFDALVLDHNIHYWSYAGTLLGAVRNKDMIPWDDDADICMDRQNFNTMLTIDPAVIEATYGLRIHVLDDEKEMVHAKVYRTGKKNSVAFMDIFVMVRTMEYGEDRLVQERFATRKMWPHGFFYTSEVEDTCRIPAGYIDGEIIMVNAPVDPIPHLVRMYGTDWIVPRKTHSHHNQNYTNRMNIYYPMSVSISIILVILFYFDYILHR